MEKQPAYSPPQENGQVLVDKDQIKKSVVEIITDLDSDIYEASAILKKEDMDETIRRSNEVQKAVVNRIKSVLKDVNFEFDIDDLNILEELLTVPEVLELDTEIKQLAIKVFDDHFNDYEPERWSVFLNSFGLYGDKDIIDTLVLEIEGSINHSSNKTPEELGEFLDDTWHWLGAKSDDVKEAIEKIINKFNREDKKIIKGKVDFNRGIEE